MRVHRRGILTRGSDAGRFEGGVLAGVRHDPRTVLLDHRRDARGEVAEAVGEFALVDGIEALEREVTVVREADLAEQEPAQRVGAVAFGGLGDRHRGSLPTC
jgi:hypothetical protein